MRQIILLIFQQEHIQKSLNVVDVVKKNIIHEWKKNWREFNSNRCIIKRIIKKSFKKK